jgi:hypothetical protein
LFERVRNYHFLRKEIIRIKKCQTFIFTFNFYHFVFFSFAFIKNGQRYFLKDSCQKTSKENHRFLGGFFSSGRNSGARTRDLLVPNQAHYQLCHVPTWREFSHVVIYHFENGIKRESSGLFRPFRQERQVSSGFRYRFGSVSSGLEGLLLR